MLLIEESRRKKDTHSAYRALGESTEGRTLRSGPKRRVRVFQAEQHKEDSRLRSHGKGCGATGSNDRIRNDWEVTERTCYG